MTCRACEEQRRALYDAVARGDARAAAAALNRSRAIAADKWRGVNVDQKYGSPPQPVARSPYRGPPQPFKR